MPLKIPGLNTYDATAGAGDIRSSKTAYVSGQKLTGNLAVSGGSASADTILSGYTVYVNGVLVTGTMEIIGRICNFTEVVPVPVLAGDRIQPDVSDNAVVPPVPTLVCEAEQIDHV